MSRFEDAIEIHAPIDRVWALVCDPRNLPRIQPTASVRLLSGTWTGIGSRHHVTERIAGRFVDSVHEITRWDEPTLIQERMTSGGTVVVATTELDAVAANRTVLVIRADVDWGGSLGALVGRIFAPMTAPARRRLLGRIRDLAESPEPDGQAHLGQEW